MAHHLKETSNKKGMRAEGWGMWWSESKVLLDRFIQLAEKSKVKLVAIIFDLSLTINNRDTKTTRK